MVFDALRNLNRPALKLTHLLESTHNSRFIALMDNSCRSGDFTGLN